MLSKRSDLLIEVAKYYTAKLVKHGETPLGVDWNGEESQSLRFAQLCKIIQDIDKSFSINDLGCGYGAFYDYLYDRYDTFDYSGIDISDNMIQAARQRYEGQNNVRYILAAQPEQAADYCVASGIFNVRLNHPDEEWASYLFSTLDTLNNYSKIGFAFNCLTAYSDAEKMRDYLYYPNPCTLFDYCKRNYSLNVALLHDYGLYEFTLLVRKEL